MIDDPSIARATIRCDRVGCRVYFRLDLETNQIAPSEIRRLDVFQVLATRMGWTDVDLTAVTLAPGTARPPVPDLRRRGGRREGGAAVSPDQLEALRRLLRRRGWEQIGPPCETWLEPVDPGAQFLFCAVAPRLGNVYFRDGRAALEDVVDVTDAEAMLERLEGR